MHFIDWKMAYYTDIKDLTAMHVPRRQSLIFGV